MPPLITVITAVRNGETYLRQTIASIQAQDFADWEYIIADDASTDGTVAAVEQALEQDGRLRLLRRSSSGGPYAAANDALLASRGTLIMRTDADDLQPPHRFSRQIAFLKANPQCRASVTYWQAFGDGGLIPGSVTALPRPRAFKWYLLLRGASIHSSLCIQREALLDLGGYRDLPLSQDYRLWCELTRRGWLGVLPEVLSYVRFHPQRSTNRQGRLQRQLALDVLRDHWLALTGELCSDELVETLWAVGYSLPFDTTRGLAALDAWERLWKADSSLDSRDRSELAELTRMRRWKFLRANLRRKPAGTFLAAARILVHQPFLRGTVSSR